MPAMTRMKSVAPAMRRENPAADTGKESFVAPNGEPETGSPFLSPVRWALCDLEM
jgi:hypothetical protein